MKQEQDNPVHEHITDVIEGLSTDWTEYATITNNISDHIASGIVEMDKDLLATVIGETAYNPDLEDLAEDVSVYLERIDWDGLYGQSQDEIVKEVKYALCAMKKDQ